MSITFPQPSRAPADNRASLNDRLDDFIRYVDSTGNTYEWIKLY